MRVRPRVLARASDCPFGGRLRRATRVATAGRSGGLKAGAMIVKKYQHRQQLPTPQCVGFVSVGIVSCASWLPQLDAWSNHSMARCSQGVPAVPSSGQALMRRDGRTLPQSNFPFRSYIASQGVQARSRRPPRNISPLSLGLSSPSGRIGRRRERAWYACARCSDDAADECPVFDCCFVRRTSCTGRMQAPAPRSCGLLVPFSH